MHHSRIFFYGCLGFLGGVLTAGIAAFPDTALLVALMTGTLGVLCAVMLFKNTPWLVLGLGVAAGALGIIRTSDVQTQWLKERTDFLVAAATHPKNITATIAGHERRQNETVYTLEHVKYPNTALSAAFPGAWSLIYTGRETFRAGDSVEIAGARFDTATTNESFLKRDRTAGSLTFPKSMTRLERACVVFWQSGDCARYGLHDALASVAESFEMRLRRVLPEPHSGLAIGLLSGARSLLPQDLKDDFKRTGLSHIVAVSGYNVTIIVFAISTLLGWLMIPRRAAFWVSTMFLIAFTLLTGASASVVRAAVMGYLAILAQKESRLYSAKTAIAFAGAMMLFQNPFLLRHDLGFLLSFLATVGLLTLFPLLEERTHTWPKLWGIKDIMLQSISAQLFVLPVLIFAFGAVSLIFLLSNVAILPFLPSTMFFSFFGGIAGYAGDIAGRIVAFPAYMLLESELRIIGFLSRIPHASVAIDSMLMRWILSGIAIAFTGWLVWRLRKIEADGRGYQRR